MHIAEPCVFDTVLRMRTNAGVRPVEFCGNMMMQNATDMEIAVIKPNSCVTIEIKHDDKLSEDFQAYVQVNNLKVFSFYSICQDNMQLLDVCPVSRIFFRRFLVPS